MMNPKTLFLTACLALASRSHSESQVILKGFNGLDNYGMILSPLTLELGYGYADRFFVLEILAGFGYREKPLPENRMDRAEKTRLIPIEGNLLFGKFGDGGTTPYFGLGYHYLFYEYDSFGDTFASDGFVVPLIFGYQVEIWKGHTLGVRFEKLLASDLEFTQQSFADPGPYTSPYEPTAGLADIEIAMAYRFSFR